MSDPIAILRQGAALVGECGARLGWELFQAQRTTLRWAATPAARRAALRDPAEHARRRARQARHPPPRSVRGPLRTLTHLLRRPEHAHPARVAAACRALARRAARHGKPRTALAFVRAAALAAAAAPPGSPRERP